MNGPARPTSWWLYVRRHLDAKGWTNADLARAVRARGGTLDGPAVSKWDARGLTPNPETVRVVALAFGRPVLEAVLASGLYTAAELQAPGATFDPETIDLSSVPHERLLAELGDRLGAARPLRGPRRGPRRRREAAADRGDAPDSVSIPASDGAPDSVTVDRRPAPEPSEPSEPSEPEETAAATEGDTLDVEQKE